jgi:N-acetylneuraminic acid mutarotase
MKLEATGKVPQPRSYHAATVAGGKLYVFGGCGVGGRLNELHAYDPASNEWRQLPSSDAVPVCTAGTLAKAAGLSCCT